MCSAGHPDDEANTYVRPDGRRVCRECARIAQRARRGRPPRVVCRCAEVEWLLLSGECWEQVVARLGVNEATLERELRRHDRADLIARATRLLPVPRTPYR